MNRKGFTLVELLATIAIMGILSGVAIMGVNRYLTKSKKQAYDTMEKSAYDAAVNYVVEHSVSFSGTEGKWLALKTLVDEGYLENPIDPNKKGSSCADDGLSGVLIYNDNDKDALDQYIYEVRLKCPSGYTSNVKYPKD